MHVYIEIVIMDNFLVDFLLLRAVGRILAPRPRTVRIVLSALLGTVYATLAPTKLFLFLLHPACKVISSCLMVWIAYGWQDWRTFLKHLLAFYGFSLAFGGLISAAGFLFGETVSAGGMLAVSGPPLWLFLILALVAEKCYGLLVQAMRRRTYSLQPCEVEYTLHGQKTVVRGIIDTGNGLYDPTNGMPVIVLPGGDTLPSDTRTLPVTTAAGTGVVKLVWPQALILRRGTECVPVSAWLGFAQTYQGTDALVPQVLAGVIKGGKEHASNTVA